MEQNGASNGQEAKPQKSPPAAGTNNSPKKRRKVNHGMYSNPARSGIVSGTSTDLGTCSCSLCVLSPICKFCIGSKYLKVLGVCAYAHLFGRS
jgi:hypothetical protein